MCKKIIGIVEDSVDDFNCAATTIYGNSDYDSLLIQDLNVETILSLISEGDISALMIDYNINFDKENKKGATLFKLIKDKVPAFPIVILTALPEAVKETFEVDADKIYEKTKFFKSESEYAREKVCHLVDNINQFHYKLNQKESSILAIIKKGKNIDINDYTKLIQLQDELSMYNVNLDSIPQELKNLDSFSKANELIEKIENLIDKL